MKRWLKLVSVGVLLLSMCSFQVEVKAKEEVQLRSKHALVYHLGEKRVLFEKNAEEKIYPASMTKIMSVLVALEEIKDINATCVINSQMLEGLQEANASVAGLIVGDTYTYEDLLYGIMLPSGADASRAIAFELFGSEEAFVEKMNQKAKQLQLKHTHFVNTSGLHDENHYTTAKEMAKIVEVALEIPQFKEIFTASHYTTKNGKLNFYSTFDTMRKEVSQDTSMILGHKTGFTLEASLCLASYVKVGEEEFVMITAKTNSDASYPYHIEDSAKLASYIKENYHRVTLVEKGKPLTSIEVQGYGKIKVKAETDISFLLHQDKKTKAVFDGYKEMNAPLYIGSYLGDYVVYEEDKEIGRIEISADDTYGKNNRGMANNQWMTTILLLLLISMMMPKKRIK